MSLSGHKVVLKEYPTDFCVERVDLKTGEWLHGLCDDFPDDWRPSEAKYFKNKEDALLLMRANEIKSYWHNGKSHDLSSMTMAECEAYWMGVYVSQNQENSQQPSQNVSLNEYSGFVTRMASKDSMKDFESKLGTGGLGLAGEAGEIADMVKKILFHGMEFTEEVRQKLIKELGDTMWYTQFFATQVLNVSLQEVIDKNVEKLNARYKTGTFTTAEFMAKESAKPKD